MAVNHELRFTPDVLAVRQAILGGRLGELLSVVHDHYCDRRNTSGWRAGEERLEMAIFSIHLIDRVQWLAGVEPIAVTALTRQWTPTVRGETFTALTIEFAEGIVGSVVSSWNAPGLPECRLRIDGTGGSALSLKDQVTGDRCELMVQVDGDGPETMDMSRDGLFVSAMGESMRRLLEAIEEGTEPAHSARDNLKTMAIMDAAYLSAARGGMRVEVSEVTA
jgi:predicted dehydrogenase